jgi:hypothetical protein
MQKTSYQKLLAGVATTLVLSFGPAAQAASTAVSQTINQGLLTLTSQPTAAMSSVDADAVHNQTSIGSLGAIDTTDSRGTAAGWSLTATASDFTKVDQPVAAANLGSGTLSSGGVYTGSTSGTYIIRISRGGAVNGAQFSVSGLQGQGPTTIKAGDMPIGGQGVTLSFGGSNYVAGDQWTVAVGVIPVSNLTLLPSSVVAQVGGPTGVTSGSGHTFSGASDSATIMTADPGEGEGWYTNTPNLSLSIPAATRAGNYAATVTETLN